VFGGVIFGEDDLPKGGDLLSLQNCKDTLMEDLIANAAFLFDDKASGATGISPPLPPAPRDQPATNYAYGSAHTKVASVPAVMQTPIRQQAMQQSPEDFTPRLPPRPGNSIHPSSRTNATSPTKSSTDVPPALPTRPGQKHVASEKLAPVPVPLLADNDSGPFTSSATLTMVPTEEKDDETLVSEEHHDSTSGHQLTLTPSAKPAQTPKSTTLSLPASVASVPTQVGSGDPPTSQSVPGGFPS